MYGGEKKENTRANVQCGHYEKENKNASHFLTKKHIVPSTWFLLAHTTEPHNLAGLIHSYNKVNMK